MSRPKWLPEDAEIVAESDMIMIIESSEDSPGRKYVLDTGETMVELTEDHIEEMEEILQSL